MRRVNLTQGSPEWKEWRQRGIGASNAPIIMVDKPKFSTKFELWCELTGLAERQPVNEFAAAAMKRGVELEPRIREKVRALHPELKFEAVPPSGSHDTLEFIRASLDDLTTDGKVLFEYKCPGKEAHAQALKGQIPDNYYIQMQTQHAVTGTTEKGWYYSWDGVEANKPIGVSCDPNREVIRGIESALSEFWQLVQSQTPPTVSTRDFILASTLVRDATKRLTAASKLLTMISEAAKAQKL
jgi:putative phage-type endonuclease